jgi:CHAT domain-containing protein/tetratricopeptide (TPR) repeat protein
MYRSSLLSLLFCSLLLTFNLSPFQIQAIRPVEREITHYAGDDGIAQEDQQARQLELGKPIERELAGGQSHSFLVSLTAGQFLHMVVEQRGIDLGVQLEGPDGKRITEVNAELRKHGKEKLSHVAQVTGIYQLGVLAKQKGAPAGSYEIRIREIRPATDHDRALQEARKLDAESDKLQRSFKFDEAFPLVERALAIRERVLGPDHLDVAITINHLGILYWRKGDFAKAERFEQRALTIYTKSLEPEHPYIASCLNGLAHVYFSRGDDAKAEPLFQQALTIWEKALGEEHTNVSMVLDSLARLYQGTSEYTKAESLYRRDLTIKERALGPEDPNVARALNNLADYYNDIGDIAKAEPLYWRALAIYEKSYGPEHSALTTSLDGLAALYGRIKGDHATAEPLYRRSLAIWEKTLGPEQFHVAPPLVSFARFYYDTGEYAKAEPLFRRALSIYEKSLGPEHIHVANALNNLAMLYAAKGDIAQAVSFLYRVNTIRERILTRNLADGSERQKLAYLVLFSKNTDFTLSLHSQAAPDDLQALNLAFTTLLRRKGRGLDAMTDTISMLRRRATPQDTKLFNRLAEVRSQLAALTLKESNAANPYSYQMRLKPLEEEVERLEADLSSRSAEFRAQSRPVTLAAVQAALPSDSTLIEFAVYTPYEPRSKKTLPPRYIVYLLGAQGQPNSVDLGEALLIDRAVDEWRKSLRNPNRPDVKRLARALDDKIMQPVRSLLDKMPGNPRHLLIAPDGSLSLIPFAALVDERYRYLVERYSISYLTSGSDLLRLQTSQPGKNAPLVVANPAFGKVVPVVMPGSQNSGKSHEDNHGRTQIDPTDLFFSPLPGTKSEALAVKAVLPEASLLMQDEATESALKHARGPRILHIATHGFFLNEKETPQADPINENDPLHVSNLRLIKWSAHIKDPLLRSGLALAGANQSRSGDDDGLLTALEMAVLDLWGTKLVVLSACDTGVGEVRNGEGVQGLRRALVLAGSESQMMSLWSVLDKSTKELMIPYYKALSEGEERSEALRRVQLRMLRSKYRRHPFYWAAFILSGDWRELEGQQVETKR